MIIITQDRDKFAWLGLGRGPMAKKAKAFLFVKFAIFRFKNFAYNSQICPYYRRVGLCVMDLGVYCGC